ncbi:MAG: hypothetical protein ACKVHQ_02955 [Gammaproteobacteria bacterium]
MNCFAIDYYDWIPAYAGMTGVGRGNNGGKGTGTTMMGERTPE